jgi:hypothetical protein
MAAPPATRSLIVIIVVADYRLGRVVINAQIAAPLLAGPNHWLSKK